MHASPDPWFLFHTSKALSALSFCGVMRRNHSSLRGSSASAEVLAARMHSRPGWKRGVGKGVGVGTLHKALPPPSSSIT